MFSAISNPWFAAHALVLAVLFLPIVLNAIQRVLGISWPVLAGLALLPLGIELSNVRNEKILIAMAFYFVMVLAHGARLKTERFLGVTVPALVLSFSALQLLCPHLPASVVSVLVAMNALGIVVASVFYIPGVCGPLRLRLLFFRGRKTMVIHRRTAAVFLLVAFLLCLSLVPYHQETSPELYALNEFCGAVVLALVFVHAVVFLLEDRNRMAVRRQLRERLGVGRHRRPVK